jgi:hypothetical protein
MAHRSREVLVEDLLARLDAPATVVWDQINDRHDTGARSLEAFDPNCTHHLVIQDDALPCGDLVAGITEALKWIPAGHPFSGYIGRVKPFAKAVSKVVTQAHDEVSFIRMAGIYWGPCVAVPTSSLPELLGWYRSSAVTNYDRRMSRWFEARNTECWYSWPSLVDHRGDESLVHGHTSKRGCHRFLGHEVSARTIDWSGEIISLENAQQMDRRRQRAAVNAARRSRSRA